MAVVMVTPENEHYPYVMGELWAARVLSQMNRRFVLVPVLRGTSGIPEYVSDLYVANAGGGPINDVRKLALEIDSIVRDNRDFEISVSDLKHRVFIGHGHSRDWEKVAGFMEAHLNFVVEEYDKTSPLGYTVTARLEQMLAASSLAIVLRHRGCVSFSNISGINEIQYDSGNWDEVFAKIRHVALREGLLPRRGEIGAAV